MAPRKNRSSKTNSAQQENSAPIGTDGTNIRPSDDQLIFDVLRFPDKRLRQKSYEVKESEIDSTFVEYIKLLTQTLFAEGGVGIAAPQVGWRKRIIIVTDREFLAGNKPDPCILLNPTLHDLEGKQESEEACLSVPMPPAMVKRAADCVVRGRDLEWQEFEHYATGMEAVIFQHEVDHLDGILYIDRISRLKKDILVRKFQKRQRQVKRYGFNPARVQKRSR